VHGVTPHRPFSCCLGSHSSQTLVHELRKLQFVRCERGLTLRTGLLVLGGLCRLWWVFEQPPVTFLTSCPLPTDSEDEDLKATLARCCDVPAVVSATVFDQWHDKSAEAFRHMKTVGLVAQPIKMKLIAVGPLASRGPWTCPRSSTDCDTSAFDLAAGLRCAAWRFLSVLGGCGPCRILYAGHGSPVDDRAHCRLAASTSLLTGQPLDPSPAG